jgi:hypothetical protein
LIVDLYEDEAKSLVGEVATAMAVMRVRPSSPAAASAASNIIHAASRPTFDVNAVAHIAFPIINNTKEIVEDKPIVENKTIVEGRRTAEEEKAKPFPNKKLLERIGEAAGKASRRIK